MVLILQTISQRALFLRGKWKMHLIFPILWIIVCHFNFGNLSYVYDYSDGYVSDLANSEWNSAGSRSVHPPRCVRIPPELTLCKTVVYENMSLPNLLGHDNLDEIKRQANPWVPLANLKCHPNTDLFLCSLYAPVCLDRPIYPCRSLCEGVQESCETHMNKYGFQWPNILKCDKFPLDDDLCIKQVNFPNSTAANVCIPCKQPLTYESLLDSYCWAQYVIKGKIDNVTIDQNGDKKLTLAKKNKFYKDDGLTKKEKRSMDVYINSGSMCDCDDANASKKKKLLMGSRQGDRFVVTYISDWGRSRKGKEGKEFKRATRAMRKGHDCKAQIREIAGQTDANNGGISTNIEPPSPEETNIEADLEETLKTTNKKKKKKKDKNANRTKGKKNKGKKDKKKGKKGRKRGKKGKKNRNRQGNNNNNNNSTTVATV